MVDTNNRGSENQRANSETLKSFSEQAISAGQEIKDKATDLASGSADVIKEQVANAVEAAKGAASQVTDKVKESVSDQKSAGADYVGSLADTIRRASKEFDTDLPIAGTYMRKAATQVASISDSIRTGDLNDVVRNAQDFARRQPTAFLGIAALTGFAVVRFLKSSADNSHPASKRSGAVSDSGVMGYRDDFAK